MACSRSLLSACAYALPYTYTHDLPYTYTHDLPYAYTRVLIFFLISILMFCRTTLLPPSLKYILSFLPLIYSSSTNLSIMIKNADLTPNYHLVVAGAGLHGYCRRRQQDCHRHGQRQLHY
jgi:hypothetical protein